MNHRSRKREYFRSFFLHFRPRSVPERTLKLSLTWGLGGTAAVLVVLLFSTGLMLKFVYEPTPESAYASILYLQSSVPFGQLIRNIHRWSANGLVLVAFLHLLRVFYTGAFTPPRQVNWMVGLALFAMVLLSNFTGYLLPWDQIAYWAITISTSMLDYLPIVGSELKQWILGGTEPGPAALLAFYAVHTAVLPVLLLFALPFHFWRIRKANGLVVPRTEAEDPAERGNLVDAMPHLIMREVAMTALVLAVVLLVSMYFNAPLAEQANPGLSPNPTKAPWYFMGIQEMLMHFHPVFAVLVIPLIVSAGLIALPFFSYEKQTSGIWFCSSKGRRMTLISAFLGSGVTVLAVLLDEFLAGELVPGPPGIIGNGLLPFAGISAACAAYYVLVRKIFKASNNEAIQSLFTLLLTAFMALTVIGIWFRGTGMSLMWAG